MPDPPTLRARLQRFVPPFLGWSLVALFFATRLYFVYQMSGNPLTWKQALSWSFLDWYLWAALSPVIFWASRRFRLRGDLRLRSFLVHAALSVGLATLHAGLYGAAVWFVKPVPEDQVTVTTLVQGLFLGQFHIGVITYWVLILLHVAFDYYRRYREEELRVSRVHERLAQAQLKALKMQLHPHFLFNTLNAVSALMHRDVDAAEKMIARLSDFLRVTLESKGQLQVPLRRELEFLSRYLEIEQARFPDRLRVKMDVDPDTLEARVPNLILQPLVENAIRHGIAKTSSSGTIEIAAHREQGDLELRVTDDGPGLIHNGTPVREGVGIANTRERLRQMYGSRHRFTLENGRERGVRVTLSFPFSAHEHEKEASP